MLELARHPEQIQKLRDELGPYMPDPTADVSHQEIATLDHLNAIIYETLRLYPPVPTALLRQTPPEGIEIEGVYIPGNMTVWCPQYAMGRSKQEEPHTSISLEPVLVFCAHGLLQKRISTRMRMHSYLSAGICIRKWSRKSRPGHPFLSVRHISSHLHSFLPLTSL